jgi:hypothetical protein
MAGLINLKLLTDFFNKIGHQRRFQLAPATSALPLISRSLSRAKRRSGPSTDVSR